MWSLFFPGLTLCTVSNWVILLVFKSHKLVFKQQRTDLKHECDIQLRGTCQIGSAVRAGVHTPVQRNIKLELEKHTNK